MSMRTVHILEKTFDIICQRGIRSSRLYDIAQACGTSVKAIHALYHTKKDLVQAALERVLEKNSAYLKVNPVLSPSAVVELSNFFNNTERILSKELKPNLLFEIKKYHPSVWNKIQLHEEQVLIPYVQRNLIWGVSEGCYRNDFDHKLYASMYFNTLGGLVNDQYLTMANTIRLITQLNRVFLHGILTPKGMRWLV
jgi:TetR/AcrR family transcriptional regulator, cholesterol catabolism regulator